MLEELKAKYTSENTVSVEFMDTVTIEPVYEAENLMTLSEMRTALQANQGGSTTYTVVAGDTFYGIAYANDMSMSDLEALNPGIDINRLMVGDVLNVKELTPVLSVQTVEEVTYTQSIPCPVEEVEDSSMYVGETRTITQGVEGQEEVNATVTYVNGQETERTVNSTTTLQEPTTTVKAVGTKEKPRTASSGSYQWPIYGRITSYFGGRYIFGSYSYHSGIDISASYGAAVCAADGGTVTYAGYRGSYGNLVVITHDMKVIEEICHRVAILDHGRVAEEGTVEEVFSRPRTEAGRRLVYPDGVPEELLRQNWAQGGGRVIRVAFNGGTAYQPLIASLAIDCGVKANILGADTRNIGGRAFGTMLLGLPEDEGQAAKALAYITSQKDITVEEVPDYHE